MSSHEYDEFGGRMSDRGHWDEEPTGGAGSPYDDDLDRGAHHYGRDFPHRGHWDEDEAGAPGDFSMPEAYTRRDIDPYHKIGRAHV